MLKVSRTAYRKQFFALAAYFNCYPLFALFINRLSSSTLDWILFSQWAELIVVTIGTCSRRAAPLPYSGKKQKESTKTSRRSLCTLLMHIISSFVLQKRRAWYDQVFLFLDLGAMRVFRHANEQGANARSHRVEEARPTFSCRRWREAGADERAERKAQELAGSSSVISGVCPPNVGPHSLPNGLRWERSLAVAFFSLIARLAAQLPPN